MRGNFLHVQYRDAKALQEKLAKKAASAQGGNNTNGNKTK